MKRMFPCLVRRLLVAAALPLLFFPAEGDCAGEARPAQGFIMDMTSLLGDNGRINAIAPGCRAMTGIMDGKALIWSRDFGAVRLVPPEGHYSMGNFISDDGHHAATFMTVRQQMGTGVDMTWARPGYLWTFGKSMQPMVRHGIVDVEWYGLSADGRVALGYGQKPLPGAPAADAPFEEHARFACTPEGQAARSRGFLTHSAFWFCVEDGRRVRQLDELGTMDTSPYFRTLSRDGRSILYKKANTVQVMDRKSGKRRQLTFGGAAPLSSATQRLPGGSMVRPGDARNPLNRWGRRPGFRSGRLFDESELKDASPDSPMYATWRVKDFFCFIPSFDARFVLAEVYLERLERSRSPWESRKLGVLARLDAAGKDVVIDDSSAIMGLDISDNGRIVLYEKATEYRIWNEDFLLPGDTVPRSLPLAQYLKRHGLALPEGLSIVSAVMSPDGECFFLELKDPDDDAKPWACYLVSTNPAIEPPHWKRSAPRDH